MSKEKIYFRIELFIALIIVSAVILWVGKDFFFASNSLYLATTDAVPHYTKIEYLAECISQFKWPSWFPYWYNGSTVMQYYPPLSFLLLTPLELIFHNSTISLKIFIFVSLAIGGMGIWHMYYRYIGKWFGIIAAVFYVAQPYFKISLLGWGVIAQAPILAVAPWHLFISISYFKSPRVKTWLIVVGLTLLLILSHAMHGFMIVLCIVIVMLAACIKRKKAIGTTFMWAAAAALAAGLAGLWWVPGVLPLETPGIPYLLPESAVNVTANWTWFIPWADNLTHAYFSGLLMTVSIVSIYFVYRDKSKSRSVLLLLYVLTVFTFIFSFGLNLPFFKYIPLAKSLVPGRILTETAIGVSILAAYLLKIIISRFRVKFFLYIIILMVLAYDLQLLGQNKIGYGMNDYKWIEEMISAVPDNGTSFQKGRLAWSAPADSLYTYFPRKYDINITSGWNIEGTIQNQYLWLQNSAINNGSYDYMIKKMNDMNVRSYYLGHGQDAFYKRLQKEGFYDIGDFAAGKLLYNSKPSSYFLKQKRDAIVIGKAVSTFVMAIPWAVEGNSKNIKDYTLRDFEAYDMILFIEPGIENVREEKYFEELVKNLAKQGKAVFIEMGFQYFPDSALGVSFVRYKGSRSTILQKVEDEAGLNSFYIPEKEEVIGLIGLDEVYYTLKQKSITKPINIIGAKHINGNKVYFIGGPLSQLLSKSLEYGTGLGYQDEAYKQRDNSILLALEDVFSKQPHYSEIGLPAFDTKNTEWDYNGCSFEYDSDTQENVMISVTYTPRWQIEVDGIKVEVKRVDNMVCVELPAGIHRVELRYCMTWVGILGWVVTGFSLLVLVIAANNHKSIIEAADTLFDKLLLYLDIKI